MKLTTYYQVTSEDSIKIITLLSQEETLTELQCIISFMKFAISCRKTTAPVSINIGVSILDIFNTMIVFQSRLKL